VAAAAKSATTAAMSDSFIARGIQYSALNGTAEGANGCHPPSSIATALRPIHGTCVEPLRPECASWIAGAAPWLRMNRVMGMKASA
jgi:hypothetical protein